MLKIWLGAIALVIGIPIALLIVLIGWAVGKTRGMRIRTP